MNDVAIFKLISGDVFLAQYKIDGGKYKIKKPAAMVMGRGSDGKPVMNLAPYMIGADVSDYIEIGMGHVVMKLVPIREVISEYNRVFGSGITLHKAGDLPKARVQ